MTKLEQVVTALEAEMDKDFDAWQDRHTTPAGVYNDAPPPPSRYKTSPLKMARAAMEAMNDLPGGAGSTSQVASAQLDRGGQSEARPGNFDALNLVRAIIRSTAGKHNVPTFAILGVNRKKNIVAARHEAMRRAYIESPLSSVQLGHIFRVDHTIILYATGRTKRRGRAWARQ